MPVPLVRREGQRGVSLYRKDEGYRGDDNEDRRHGEKRATVVPWR